MATFSKFNLFTKLEKTPIVPVFYHSDLFTTFNVVKACYQGGIRVFEFTNRGDFAHEIFGEIKKRATKEFPELSLGVGSIVDAPTAAQYIQLGADFIVAPLLNADVAKVCNRRQVTYIPGCGSISEIGNAQELGCEIVKVFPGDVLGPKFVKDLMAPMPWTKVMVTGGVEPTFENLQSWFNAGTFAVGIGCKLFPSDKIKVQDWDYISNKCKEAIQFAER